LGVDFPKMLASLASADPGTIVVLHACCHNPTGYDITPSQWKQVVETLKAKGLTAFLDMAYQGFGHGIAEDGAVIDLFVQAGLSFQKFQPLRRARWRLVCALRNR
jgi:aromatic-amino-acid transaminase